MRFLSTSLTLPFLFFLSVTSVRSQVTVKQIKESNPHSKEVYIFPSILVPGNTGASEKINNQLKKNLARVSDLSYAIPANTSKLFSISITSKGYGKPLTHFYSFNTKTGDRIIADSLFTKKGLDLLRDSLRLKHQEVLQNNIKAVQDTLSKNAFISIDDKKHYEEMLFLYKECFDIKAGFTLDDLNFYLTPTALFVSSRGCITQIIQALDEIGEFNFEFKLADWKEYFTPYILGFVGR